MDIGEFRKQIDEIDDALTALFVKRMALSEQIAQYKMQTDKAVHDPDREQGIIRRLTEKQSGEMQEYIKVLYETIFDLSKSYQRIKIEEKERQNTIKYGLLGKSLSHSISPLLHQLLGNDDYCLVELKEEELPYFLTKGNWRGLNVTIPYKKSVVAYCDELTARAEKIGAVNVLIKDEKGKIIGDNTDYVGLWDMIISLGLNIADKKVLILGSGGASATAQAVCADMKAKEIMVISRTGEHNYTNIQKHNDAQIIINTTPVGMFPNGEEAPISLDGFSRVEGVLDCIYNPLRSSLILAAQKKGILCTGGLEMLTSQAYEAHICFGLIPKCSKEELYDKVRKKRENLVLVGMPGAGKTTIGKALAEDLQMPFYDIDTMIEQRENLSIEQIFAQFGEEYFRQRESELLKEICTQMGAVIVPGGGSVLREENRLAMKSNGKIILVKRELAYLATEGRPLSKDRESLQRILDVRMPIYEELGEIVVENNEDIFAAVEKIKKSM